MKAIRNWKKVYEQDLDYIVAELKESTSVPACIILTGEVGAGKTTFVQHFLPGAKVTSPSYSLVNEVGPIAHGDFYRINDKAEIMELELGLYLEEKDYFLAEWGKEYLETLKREMPQEFNLYELVLTINNKVEDGQDPSRNLELIEL